MRQPTYDCMKTIFDLSSEEFICLLEAYDAYQEANEENRYLEGWYPVCIEEFLNNDFEFYG